MGTIDGEWKSGLDPMDLFARQVEIVMRDRRLTPEQLDALTRRPPRGLVAHTLAKRLPSLEELIRLAAALRFPLSGLVSMFDPDEAVAPGRTAHEVALLEAARRLSLRDLLVLVHVARAFPEEGERPADLMEAARKRRR